MSYLITIEFLKPKAAKNAKAPDKPIPVYLKIAQSERLEDSRKRTTRRLIPTGILGFDKEIVEKHKTELKSKLRLLYCILENRLKSNEPFSLDDIVDDFKRAEKSDESFAGIVERSKSEDFKFDPGVATMGRIFDQETDPLNTRILGDLSVSLLQYLRFMSGVCKQSGQTSLSQSYLGLFRSLGKYSSQKDILFKDIDRDFVIAYSGWLHDTGVLDSTRSFYLRTMRMALNHAADDGYTAPADNLFVGLNANVEFKRTSGIMTADSLEILRRIAAADYSGNPDKELIRDMFMFAFYCRGMEFVGILSLPKSAVKDNVLTYKKRQKGIIQTIPLDEGAAAILEKYKPASETMVFPLAEKYSGLTHTQIGDKIRMIVKEIGDDAGYSKLTFSMNARLWDLFISQLDVSRTLIEND